ncbi:MAG: homogentisate 1,2-dioxygenase, partial [Frankiales bacterium]|nr:homogentisate 1,2-dioxygenase [Frankiales bacterium]
MVYYRSAGAIPPKRHTQHRSSEGDLYYEELMGEEGFSSHSSLLYHRAIPSALVDSRIWSIDGGKPESNHPLKPYHFKVHGLFPGEAWRHADPVRDRRVIL